MIVTQAPWGDNRPPRQGIFGPEVPRQVLVPVGGAEPAVKMIEVKSSVWWFGLGQGSEPEFCGHLQGAALSTGCELVYDAARGKYHSETNGLLGLCLRQTRSCTPI